MREDLQVVWRNPFPPRRERWSAKPETISNPIVPITKVMYLPIPTTLTGYLRHCWATFKRGWNAAFPRPEDLDTPLPKQTRWSANGWTFE